MFTIDPKSLSDTRIQLHWASQLLAAAADATVEKASDDSHSNLGWNGAQNRLVGRADCQIDVVKFELLQGDDSLKLTGIKLNDALQWLADRLDAKLTLREYDLPSHTVGKDAAFDPNMGHLAVIASWFSFGHFSLEKFGELRVWPHHFDLGFWKPSDIEGKSIGGGFSLGDDTYDYPYFYVNPYGIERPDGSELPELSGGQWTDNWFGAVITSDDLQSADRADSLAAEFLESAWDACQRLITH